MSVLCRVTPAKLVRGLIDLYPVLFIGFFRFSELWF